MSFSKNVSYMFLVQVGNYLAPLILLPFLARTLGVDGFGYLSIFFSLCAIVMIISDFGFSLSGTNYVSKYKSDKDKINKFIYSTLLIKLSITTIISFIFCIYILLYSNFPQKKIVCLISILINYSQVFQFTWLYQGIEKMKFISFYTLTSKLLYVIFVFMLIRDESDFLLVIFLYSVTQVISSFISSIGVIKEGYTLKHVSFIELSKLVKQTLPFFLSRVAIIFYTSANTFILSIFSGISSAGIYAAGEKLYQAGQNATSPVTQVLFPMMVHKKSYLYLLKVVSLMYVPVVIACILSFIYAENIIILFFGDEFLASTVVLKLLMITLCINFLNANLGYPAFAIIDKLNICNMSVVIGAILQMCNIFTIWLFIGINEVTLIYGLILTELLILIFRLSYLIRYNMILRH